MPAVKNVLIFNHSYGPQFIDVSNQYARLFENPLYKVTVVYLIGAANEQVRQKTLGAEVIFLAATPRQTRGLKLQLIRKMAELQRKKNFAVVICHRYKPSYIMLWLARSKQFPLFISVMHELGTMRSLARRLLVLALAPKNWIIAGVSKAVRNDLRQSLWGIPMGRIITLYNMIDVEATALQLLGRQQARKALNLAPQAFVFGNVGRLAKNKDQATLLAAYARFKSQLAKPPTDTQLIILGDGVLEESLKKQACELGIEKEVIFAGFVQDAFRYMCAFDVYVTSATQEAFGRVLLEAMIARLPTIATRVNGMPEVLGKTGILVEPRALSELANAMLETYLATALKRQAWGEQAYQRAVEDFSLPRFAEVMEMLLRGNLLPGLDSNQ